MTKQRRLIITALDELHQLRQLQALIDLAAEKMDTTTNDKVSLLVQVYQNMTQGHFKSLQDALEELNRD